LPRTRFSRIPPVEHAVDGVSVRAEVEQAQSGCALGDGERPNRGLEGVDEDHRVERFSHDAETSA
jgi:hypothetical protein